MRPFTAGFSYTGWPSRVISPLSGRYMPVKCRMMVDFPAPLGPTRPYTAPWGTVMLTPSRARKPSKVFTTFFASSIAVPSFPKVRPFLPGHAQVPQLLHQGLHPGGDLRPPAARFCSRTSQTKVPRPDTVYTYPSVSSWE